VIEVSKIVGEVVNLTNNIVNKVDGVDGKTLFLLFGLLVVLIVILTVFVPCPTAFQKIILRLTIAIGITGLFSTISNYWEGRSKLYRGPISVGLFIFIYLGSILGIQANDCQTYFYSEGQVFKRNIAIKGVTIRLPHQDFEMLSNASGEFFIPWKAEKDSSTQVLVQMEWEGGDTSFYWTKNANPLTVHLPYYYSPLSLSIIEELINQHVLSLEKKTNANLLEWQIDSSQVTSHERLVELYEPFDLLDGNRQNNYAFHGLNQHLTFKKNLITAGINNLKAITPYEKHGIESCAIYILNSALSGGYKLDYLLLNLKKVQHRIVQQKRVSDTKYRLTVAYKNNIRGVRVDLEEQRRENIVKVRHMNFFGFLPTEEYEVQFKHGKWTLLKLEEV
jgi:hypothetical protein